MANTPRLPIPGQDDGTWGTILNQFLTAEHNTDGSLKIRTDGTVATLTSGKIPTTNLGGGTASSSNFLRGDGTWAVPSGGGTVTSVTATDGTITVGGSSAAPTIGVGTIPESKVTNLTTDLAGKAPTTHTHAAAQISDSTTVGQAVLTAADAAAARTAIGAGTSNLALGTTSSTAKAGDYAPTKTDVGLGNVDNTSDATKNAATATLTNKTISGASNTLTNIPESAITNLTADLAGKVPLADPSALIISPDTVSKAGLWVTDKGGRPLPPPSKVISRFASGHAWTSGADDTTIFIYGDRSYKGTTNGAGGSLYLSSPTFAAQDWSSSIIRIAVRIDDPTKVQTFQAYVTTGSGNVMNAGVQQNLIANEWAILTISRSQFATVSGTPVWTGVTQFQLRFQDKSTGAININVNAVELLPDLASTYSSGVFVLEADDGYIGQKTYMLPVVSVRGIPVTYNVIADRFVGGTPASGMSADDLRTFQNKYGWNISNHAYATSVHNTLSSATQLEVDFLQQKQWLHSNGLHYGVDEYALCPGTGSPVAEGSILETIRRNFRSARVNSGFYETVIPGDPHKLRSVLFSGNTNAQIQANIDAVAGAGGVFIFTVHDVLSGSTNGTSNSLPAMAANNLATILDYAAGKGMVFRTRADLLERR